MKRSFCRFIRPEKHSPRIFWVGAALVSVTLLTLRGCSQRGCRAGDLTTVPESILRDEALQAAAEGEPQKLVCLTFDDGPSRTTPRVLDVLAEQGVPATFFVMAAENNREYLPLVEREVREGNQVALHTACHEYSRIYAEPNAFWQDIKELRAALSPYLNTDDIHYLRFPGGSTNTVSRKYGGSDLMKRLKAQAEEQGYRYVDWNVCAEDAAGGHPGADRILENIIRDVGEKRICIVLMHDTAATGTTADALPRIIEWFRERGYQFCTVEQMDALRDTDETQTKTVE